MARYGGGPVTYRALNGPRAPEKSEVLRTLAAIREVRAKVDRSELVSARMARELGITWSEIAAELGVSRQAAWERLREMEPETTPARH